LSATTGWVLVTRAEDEIGELTARLGPRGIAVVPYPVLTEVDHEDAAGWAAAEEHIAGLSWIVLTSARAPRAFRRVAQARGVWAGLLPLPGAAVGEATARAGRECGLDVRIVGGAGGRELASLLLAHLQPGDAVLHPCGRERRPELEEALAEGGVLPLPIAVYAMEPTPTAALPELPHDAPLAIVLTSPRAAESYLRAVGRRYADIPHLALGGTTSRAAGAAGLKSVVVARPTSEATVEEICRICS
jgi:uroporphyrinogen-III synthase